MNRRIYLDYAAATPVRKEVLAVMRPYFAENFGNPSSLYEEGTKARIAIDRSRRHIGRLIGASQPDEIVFTSGGTESCNLAILGVARANQDQGKHICISKLEHHSVLAPTIHLTNKEGFKHSEIDPDSDGIISPDSVRSAIREDTILVSVIYANNEIGVISPISEIAKVVQRVRKERTKSANKTPVYLHTDACQAAGYLDINVQKLGTDLMTLNSNKIYGSKGVGVLFVRSGTNIEPLMYGGAQEHGLRSGTENVANIVGFAKALSLAQEEKAHEVQRLANLSNYLWQSLKVKIPEIILNGDAKKRLPNNINITIPGIDSEALLYYLDEHGISASTGSACDSREGDSSHVLEAIGRTKDEVRGSIRFSLGRSTKKADIDYLLNILPVVIEKLSLISIHAM